MKVMNSITKVLYGLAAIVFLVACDKSETSAPEDIIYYQPFSVNMPDYIDDVILYDVDGDMINDLEITRTVEKQPVDLGFDYKYKIEFNCINESMELCVNKTDKKKTFIKLDDDISSKDLFEWKKTLEVSGTGGSISKEHLSSNWRIYDYFGFQIIKGNKTHYGWFHFKPFEIQEVAINKTANKSIKVGQKE
ncbi:hypothetical protein ACXR6G_18720 [Ancylomarina sp. YFZ004]